MLVLSRKERESIEITKNGQHIATVAVIQVQGNKCRIGIKADQSVSILRSELEPRNEPKAA